MLVCLSGVTDSHHHQPSGATEREVFATATDRKRRLRRTTIVTFVLYTIPTTLLLDLRNALKRLQRLLPFKERCVITRKLLLSQIQKAIWAIRHYITEIQAPKDCCSIFLHIYLKLAKVPTLYTRAFLSTNAPSELNLCI